MADTPIAAPPPMDRAEQPWFEPNQVLLAEQLNGITTALDAQLRATRLHGIGVGIVDGLDIGWDTTQRPATLNITPGAAITSAGHLIALQRGLTLTHARPYREVRPDGAGLPAGWAAFERDIWALDTAESEGATALDGWLDARRQRAGLVVLLLERADQDIDPCGAVGNCRDQGRRIKWTRRALFIDGGRSRLAALGLSERHGLDAGWTPIRPEPPELGDLAEDERRPLDERCEEALTERFGRAALRWLQALHARLRAVDRFSAQLGESRPLPGQVISRLIDELSVPGQPREVLDRCLEIYRFALTLARVHDALRAAAESIVGALVMPAAVHPTFVSLGCLAPRLDGVDGDDFGDDGPDAVRARRAGLRHGPRPAGDAGRNAQARRAWLDLRDRLAIELVHADLDAPRDEGVGAVHPDALQPIRSHADAARWPSAVGARPWTRTIAEIDRPRPVGWRATGLRGKDRHAVRRLIASEAPDLAIEVIDLNARTAAVSREQAAAHARTRQALVSAAHALYLTLGAGPHIAGRVGDAIGELRDRMPGIVDAVLRAFPPTSTGGGGEVVGAALVAWRDLVNAAAEARWLFADASEPGDAVWRWFDDLRACARRLFAIDVQPVFDALAAEVESVSTYIRRNRSTTVRAMIPSAGTLVLVTRGDVIVADLAHPGRPAAPASTSTTAMVATYLETRVGVRTTLFDCHTVPTLASRRGWRLDANDGALELVDARRVQWTPRVAGLRRWDLSVPYEGPNPPLAVLPVWVGVHPGRAAEQPPEEPPQEEPPQEEPPHEEPPPERVMLPRQAYMANDQTRYPLQLADDVIVVEGHGIIAVVAPAPLEQPDRPDADENHVPGLPGLLDDPTDVLDGDSGGLGDVLGDPVRDIVEARAAEPLDPVTVDLLEHMLDRGAVVGEGDFGESVGDAVRGGRVRVVGFFFVPSRVLMEDEERRPVHLAYVWQGPEGPSPGAYEVVVWRPAEAVLMTQLEDDHLIFEHPLHRRPAEVQAGYRFHWALFGVDEHGEEHRWHEPDDAPRLAIPLAHMAGRMPDWRPDDDARLRAALGQGAAPASVGYAHLALTIDIVMVDVPGAQVVHIPWQLPLPVGEQHPDPGEEPGPAEIQWTWATVNNLYAQVPLELLAGPIITDFSALQDLPDYAGPLEQTVDGDRWRSITESALQSLLTAEVRGGALPGAAAALQVVANFSAASQRIAPLRVPLVLAVGALIADHTRAGAAPHERTLGYVYTQLLVGEADPDALQALRTHLAVSNAHPGFVQVLAQHDQ